MKTKTARPLLRVAALTASAMLSACGSGGGAEPLPGNPKGTHFDENTKKADELIIAGTITLPPLTETEGIAAMYVSIRPVDGGPPVAAKRMNVGPFPQKFELTRADMMNADGDIPNSFKLKIALDKDGDAMTKEDLPKYEGTHNKGTQALDVPLLHSAAAPPPELRMPGNPKGSMYDNGVKEPIATPKLVDPAKPAEPAKPE